MAEQKHRSAVAAFAADPASAAEARRFVFESLTSMGVNDSTLERAELIATELVTNAVLHTSGAPTVTVRVIDDVVRIEVQDQSSVAPTLRNYGRDAATGRGLNIVSVTAKSWGVEPTPSGKTVWAEIPLEHAADPSPATRIEGSPFPESPAVEDGAGKTVRFIGVPVSLYLALEQHNESVLRECELLAIQLNLDDRDRRLELPTRLSELVVRAMKYFNVQVQAFRLAVQEAEAKGRKTVELTTRIVPESLEHSRDFVSVMTDADEMSEQGLLLTAPAAPDVRRLRLWFLEETQLQLDGKTAAPYPS